MVAFNHSISLFFNLDRTCNRSTSSKSSSSCASTCRRCWQSVCCVAPLNCPHPHCPLSSFQMTSSPTTRTTSLTRLSLSASRPFARLFVHFEKKTEQTERHSTPTPFRWISILQFLDVFSHSAIQFRIYLHACLDTILTHVILDEQPKSVSAGEGREGLNPTHFNPSPPPLRLSLPLSNFVSLTLSVSLLSLPPSPPLPLQSGPSRQRFCCLLSFSLKRSSALTSPT